MGRTRPERDRPSHPKQTATNTHKEPQDGPPRNRLRALPLEPTFGNPCRSTNRAFFPSAFAAIRTALWSNLRRRGPWDLRDRSSAKWADVELRSPVPTDGAQTSSPSPQRGKRWPHGPCSVCPLRAQRTLCGMAPGFYPGLSTVAPSGQPTPTPLTAPVARGTSVPAESAFRKQEGRARLEDVPGLFHSEEPAPLTCGR